MAEVKEPPTLQEYHATLVPDALAQLARTKDRIESLTRQLEQYYVGASHDSKHHDMYASMLSTTQKQVESIVHETTSGVLKVATRLNDMLELTENCFGQTVMDTEAILLVTAPDCLFDSPCNSF